MGMRKHVRFYPACPCIGRQEILLYISVYNGEDGTAERRINEFDRKMMYGQFRDKETVSLG